MGICICEKHGRAGNVETCVHVARDIDDNRFGRYEKNSLFGVVLLCQACFETTGFSKIQEKFGGSSVGLPEDEAFDALEAAYDRIDGRRTYCSECVAAAEVTQARREGRSDPFPVYERTLTSNNRKEIDDFKRHLLSHFEFKNSIRMPNQPSLLVTGGTYRYPLTVKIYYVLEENDQQKILDLTAQFLKRFSLNQAKIEFWKEEIWESWTNPKTGFRGGRRGDELMLREIYLNCP